MNSKFKLNMPLLAEMALMQIICTYLFYFGTCRAPGTAINKKNSFLFKNGFRFK